MKKGLKSKQILYTVFFLFMTGLILTHSQKSISYALNGLNLWFTKMIPSLLPFMIISGIMIRLRLTEGFASVMHPILGSVFRVRKNVTYAIIMGFLCGFPMGARVTCDLLERNMITKREALLLLAFCNNIGPVYFTGFVLPLLHRRHVLPYLIGMYGLPLLYGLLMRYTVYRDLYWGVPVESFDELLAASNDSYSLLEQVDDAITAAIRSILTLGGYMILFNLFNLVPDCIIGLLQLKYFGKNMGAFIKELPYLIAPILEITGGLGILGDRLPLCSLLVLPFGGLSCIAQTYSIIRYSGLSIHTYVYHKLALTVLTVLYYAVWKVCFPIGFLS